MHGTTVKKKRKRKLYLALPDDSHNKKPFGEFLYTALRANNLSNRSTMRSLTGTDRTFTSNLH